MKKGVINLISMLLVCVLVFSVPVSALSTDTNATDLEFTNIDYTKSETTRIILNNNPLAFSVNPQIINGTTIVPFRAIFEALGLSVGYDSTTQTVKGKNDKYDVSLIIGNTIATVNGESKTLTVAPQIINGSTMIPLRFISETLGYHVVWVGDSNLILISDKNIVEWRSSGHDTSTGKIIETKYINGVATTTTRNTDIYWVSSIELSSYLGNITVGSSYKINISSNKASDKAISYVSSNTSVATVDNNGTVYGKALGITNITVTNKNNDTSTIIINVQSNEQYFKLTCKDYTYDEVARYPENYKGKSAHFEGKVVQVIAPNSSNPLLKTYGQLLVAVTKKVYGTTATYSDIIIVGYETKDYKLLENDIINLYGTMCGTETYTTVLNVQKTVPSMYANYVDLQK